MNIMTFLFGLSVGAIATLCIVILYFGGDNDE